MSTVAHRAARGGHRTIRLALTEADYERFFSDGEGARAQFDQLHGQHPELLPEEWGHGYVFDGFTQTKMSVNFTIPCKVPWFHSIILLKKIRILLCA